LSNPPDIFLSYNREDQAVASRYAEAFAAEGLDVWWDTALRSGEAYDEVTEAALRGAKAVVVLWSPRSVVSRWVRAEATIADRCKTLVPVMIEACERPIMFELTQTAELSRADPTLLPVEISSWVLFRFMLMPRSVCRATIELEFVRILDIVYPSRKGCFAPVKEKCRGGGSDGFLTDAGCGFCCCPRHPVQGAGLTIVPKP